MFKRPSNQELTNTLNKCHSYTYESYLSNLTCLKLYPPPQASTLISILKIKDLPSSEVASLFTFTLQALGSLNTVVAYIIHAHKDTLEYYIGLKYTPDTTYALNLLINGFSHAFPNASFTTFNNEQSTCWLSHILSSEYMNTVSSAHFLPKNVSKITSQDATSKPLLSMFTKQMANENYVALFLATSIQRSYLLEQIYSLNQLYTILTRYNKQIFINSQQMAKNHSNTITCNDSSTKSSSVTENNGSSCSKGETCYTNISGSTPLPITEERNLNTTLTLNQAHSNTHSNSNSCAQCNTFSNGDSRAEATQNATNLSNNKSCSFTEENKDVTDQLLCLSNLLAHLNTLTASTTFGFSSYFLSTNVATSIRSAYTFAGLAVDDSMVPHNTFINTWQSDSPNFNPILKQLSYLHAPCFITDDYIPFVPLHTLISASTLFNVLYCPF